MLRMGTIFISVWSICNGREKLRKAIEGQNYVQIEQIYCLSKDISSHSHAKQLHIIPQNKIN